MYALIMVLILAVICSVGQVSDLGCIFIVVQLRFGFITPIGGELNCREHCVGSELCPRILVFTYE